VSTCTSQPYPVCIFTHNYPVNGVLILVPEGGDASTGYLAALQDPIMAALKDSTIWDSLAPGAVARGRDNYGLLGVIRTKPGRADSLPTRSMSCSDKIALWNVVGFQGAVATHHLVPLYISAVIIGGVPLSLQPLVRQDCERACWGRLQGERHSS
jgi:tRNA-specific adenosine deaminase 1